MAKLAVAIGSLKSDKAAGVDEIRPEMLKALGEEGVLWLSRVIKVAGFMPEDWLTGVIIPIFKKKSRCECSNYKGITLMSIPGKVYAKMMESRCRAVVEEELGEYQCGFRPGRSTSDQQLTLRLILESSWEFAQPVFACFVDLEMAYDRVPRKKL